MKKIIFLMLFSLCISSFAADFKWSHSYQPGSSQELISLSNMLAGNIGIKSAATEGFAVQRPAFSLKCGKGTVAYEMDEQKIIRGIYFEGQASVSFNVQNAIEQDHLERYIDKRSLDNESIEAVYILPLGSCPDLPAMPAAAATSTMYPRLLNLKEALRRNCMDTLRSLLNSGNNDSRDIMILFEYKGEVWAYRHDSRSETEVQLLRLSHPLQNDYWMWDPAVAIHEATTGVLKADISQEEYQSKFQYDVENFQINYSFDENGTLLSGEVKVDIQLKKPLRALIFKLFPAFSVNQVKVNGEGAYFLKEGYSEGWGYCEDSLLVNFDKPKEGPMTLVFTVTGKLFEKGSGYVFMKDEDLWFPNIEDFDGATLTLTANVPKEYEVIGIGELAEHKTNPDGTESYKWESREKIYYATFLFGKFLHSKIEAEGLELDVALPKGLRTNILTQAQNYTLEELKNIVAFYIKFFGPLPCKSIKVGITQYSFGRGFNSRGFSFEKERTPEIDISSTLPVDTVHHGGNAGAKQEIMPLSISPSAYGRGFPTLLLLCESTFYRTGSTVPNKLLALEVARQWWGNLINGLSYRDAWLTEGLSEFSSRLYMNTRFGEGATKFYNENSLAGGTLTKRGNLDTPIESDEYSSQQFFAPVKQFQKTAEETNTFKEGPICLGTRLIGTYSSQPTKNYEDIIYTKGSFVFQMLFSLSRFTKEGNDGFFRGFQTICTKYKGQKISTQEFFKELETSMKIPLGVFLKGWFESNGIPQVEARTSIVQKDGKYVVIAEAKTDKDLFFGVPVRIDLPEKKTAEYLLLFQNKNAKGEWTLPAKPKDVEVDPVRTVFCTYGKIKS
jgi:hypothetical protein